MIQFLLRAGEPAALAPICNSPRLIGVQTEILEGREWVKSEWVITPAMAAGIESRVWEIDDIVKGD
jgi:hypothetical protein